MGREENRYMKEQCTVSPGMSPTSTYQGEVTWITPTQVPMRMLTHINRRFHPASHGWNL